jgi:hypothetical protein
MTSTECIAVNGIRMNQQQCYLKAAELDPQFENAFLNLSNTLPPTSRIDVNGISMNQRDCYRKVLDIEPGNTFAQNALQRLDEAEVETAATPASSMCRCRWACRSCRIIRTCSLTTLPFANRWGCCTRARR